MFMNRIKTLQELLDISDFHLLEVYQKKTDEELLKLLDDERKLAVAHNRIDKSIDQIAERVNIIEAIIEMRAINRVLRELDEQDADAHKGISIA